ncbi:putative M18 family aminopeptidase 1 [Andreesenia angusta]|uniref:M18 family aminopeptidase n=1 Tax=Andreesenia angusta TaxID=39480 RepID=A0A1S1V7E3_9FIRM|nr:aminopeptidase [Andreesenia angusta]OHW62482.1 putative M18 family aminopeptidase 1 [Andreesenia angusta]
MEEKLLHSWGYVWDTISEEEKTEVFELGERYKEFLDSGKTERECTEEIIERARAAGFISMDEALSGDGKLMPGDKVYANNRDKSVVLFVIGSEAMENGVNIVASHLDSPRIDLKPFPLYEEEGLGFFKTHYYGGIKKYQWATIPLELHGVVFTKTGEKVNVQIGKSEDDPVFFITDLLPHLAKDQMDKKLSEAITGEGLNVLVGSNGLSGVEENRVKSQILSILNEKYGISELDFTTSELQIVPAGRSRDVGLDRSMIAGYGQDDRVCVYSSLEAILEVESPERTAVSIYMDKEEIGSVGNTGMESVFFELALAEIMNKLDESYSEIKLKRALSRSRALSADTVAAFDPNFPDVLDKKNAPFMGKGMALVKYTGVRGKSETNDANAEYLSDIRQALDRHNVIWQIGELGKVDQGGGGTVAYMLAKYGMEVVDCGVSLLSVHAPFEISHKADIYMAKRGYKAFLEN